MIFYHESMHKLRYVPGNFEEIYLTMLQIWLTHNGFHDSTLPPIYLSFQELPKFEKSVSYKRDSCTTSMFDNNTWNVLIAPDEEEEMLGNMHKEGEGEHQKKNLRQSHAERRRLLEKEISRLKTLSVYCSETREIILFPESITWNAQTFGIPVESIRTLFMTYAIHQWLTEIIPDNIAQDWLNPECNANSIVDAVWEQFYTYWSVVKEADNLSALVHETIEYFLSYLNQALEEQKKPVKRKVSAHRQEKELPVHHKKRPQRIIPFKEWVAIGVFAPSKNSQN